MTDEWLPFRGFPPSFRKAGRVVFKKAGGFEISLRTLANMISYLRGLLFLSASYREEGKEGNIDLAGQILKSPGCR